MPLKNLKLISAGAGSGKTYRLTQEMTALLTSGAARPSGIIATTFTKRAAAELKERVRVKLLREGMTQEANELKNALIGTVHGLGVKLLKRFAFEAGVSPQVDIIADEDHQRLFNLSMAAVIKVETIEEIEELCDKLGLSLDGEKFNWRKEVLRVVDIIRGNNFDADAIAKSKRKSWEELAKILPPVNAKITDESFRSRLKIALSETIAALEANEDVDATKVTATGKNTLKRLFSQLNRKGYLPWYELCKLANFKAKGVGAKSRDLVDPIVEIGQLHPTLSAFQNDLHRYQDLIFDCAEAAIAEYDKYKKNRGRIDYTDMEVLVLGLLDNPSVQETLRRELDLLMVDEFQDTSPIQLALFLRLSELAKQSVWVGDPKQSIYGFRGAEPRLMKAVMNANGPVNPANIQKKSWRSREDVVYACNAIFTKAFPDITEEAVVLDPVRTREGSELAPAESPEFAERSGIMHWHFELDGKGRISKSWTMDVLAKAITELLENPPLILPKGSDEERPLIAGDIAILCRTNYGCVEMASALAKQGLPAAIARTGLLQTAESTLILACLKYLLNSSDSLSVAEILLFGSRHDLPNIIDSRLDFLEEQDDDSKQDRPARWEENDPFISILDGLRTSTGEHSTSEMINLLLERLDLRRVIVAWGDGEQRLSNVDELRRLAVAYEDNCHRLHRAASLGGYLLYLDQLLRAEKDAQGASERPEAVNVLTYHRSKGLEWPAVVAMNLDQKLRADVWGISVEAEKEEVDLSRPLADRWLKYWVNPYGRQTKGVDWLEALSESQWQVRSTDAATAEEARLLYVGFTRARDYLILPTNKDGAPWLDRAFARGGGTVPVLTPDSTDAPFDWGGKEVNKFLQTWTEPRNLPSAELGYTAVPFIDELREGRKTYPDGFASPEWRLDNYGGGTLARQHRYFSPSAPDPATDERLYGQAIGNFLSGMPTQLDPAIQIERAASLLENYLPGGETDPQEMVNQATAFSDWLKQNYPTATVRRRVPLNFQISNKQIHLTADWLLELDNDQLVLIQDVYQSGKQFDKQSAQHVADLALTQDAVRSLTGKVVAESWLHLPVMGCVWNSSASVAVKASVGEQGSLFT
ncbi:AAA family ATPase [Neolewinella aurantiaca]|uniref:DNA 3'-5' helicase n=1 Tax=Neolewinella aurantiaca TaxID=2602767 RepID=A0A5C7FW08_9BACT|nr:UvrD-helicase domain-containing protein [Neolewinella aurantiaca]TXF90837.1 AAA family ATPase [Neolewinella aurantiaca]